MIFLDVDDFKRKNDVYTHRTRDESLKRAADALSSKARQTDTVARQGGDEFTVLLAGAPLPEAQNLFGRLREEAAEYSEHELGFRLSLSAGASSFPSDGGDPNGLLEAADTAMYRAKRSGKDWLYYRFMDAGWGRARFDKKVAAPKTRSALGFEPVSERLLDPRELNTRRLEQRLGTVSSSVGTWGGESQRFCFGEE